MKNPTKTDINAVVAATLKTETVRLSQYPTANMSAPALASRTAVILNKTEYKGRGSNGIFWTGKDVTSALDAHKSAK